MLQFVRIPQIPPEVCAALQRQNNPPEAFNYSGGTERYFILRRAALPSGGLEFPLEVISTYHRDGVGYVVTCVCV